MIEKHSAAALSAAVGAGLRHSRDEPTKVTNSRTTPHLLLPPTSGSALRQPTVEFPVLFKNPRGGPLEISVPLAQKIMNSSCGELLGRHVQAAGFLGQLLLFGCGNLDGQLHGVLRMRRFYRISTIKGDSTSSPPCFCRSSRESWPPPAAFPTGSR